MDSKTNLGLFAENDFSFYPPIFVNENSGSYVVTVTSVETDPLCFEFLVTIYEAHGQDEGGVLFMLDSSVGDTSYLFYECEDYLSGTVKPDGSNFWELGEANSHGFFFSTPEGLLTLGLIAQHVTNLAISFFSNSELIH